MSLNTRLLLHVCILTLAASKVPRWELLRVLPR